MNELCSILNIWLLGMSVNYNDVYDTLNVFKFIAKLILLFLLLFAFTIINKQRCTDTEISDVVSGLLSALLTRLTDLKSHEEDLNASQLESDLKVLFS